MKKSVIVLLLVSFSNLLHSQSFDIKTFNILKAANPTEFTAYSKSVNLEVETDDTSESIFAKTKGCIYTKPVGVKNDNENYKLALIVSTQNKENNKLILKDATEYPNKKGTWTEGEYLYIEWDTKNPISQEMWYKVLVYKRKK